MQRNMPHKILVVDDEPDLQLLMRQKFRRYLRRDEWAFTFAEDGKEALDRLQADPDIGLILTDLNMPRMDGLTLLRHLADLNRTFRTVVVSAYGDMANIRTAMNRGAFDFVTKPIDFEDLETTMLKSLRELHTFQEAAAARRKLAAVQRELDIARRIQEAALPAPFPDRADVAVYGKMIAAREVGGDFYDYFLLDDHRLGVVIGDASGKGITAALFMTVCRMALKTLASQGTSPDACIRALNRQLYPESLSEMFVTVFFGVLDLHTGHLAYCNAGHNLPFVCRTDGAVVPLERVGGIAVCLLKDFPYRAGAVTLEPGDGLLMYTDGLSEARNPEGQEFSEAGLQHALTEMVKEQPKETVYRLMEQVSAFADLVSRTDDITLLAVRYQRQDGT